MTIKLLRLLTGEEIITEVTSETLVALTIKNPIRVVVLPNKDNSPQATPQIGFAPWMQFGEDKSLEIRKEHILVSATPIKDFLDHYKQTFSNIILPNNREIILPES